MATEYGANWAREKKWEDTVAMTREHLGVDAAAAAARNFWGE